MRKCRVVPQKDRMGFGFCRTASTDFLDERRTRPRASDSREKRTMLFPNDNAVTIGQKYVVKGEVAGMNVHEGTRWCVGLYPPSFTACDANDGDENVWTEVVSGGQMGE